MDKLIPTEEQEQKVLVQWLELNKIEFFHPPNEGKHKVQYRVKQKQLGVKPGVPDILIVDPPPSNPGNVGVAIELKRRKGGRTSKEQKDWLRVLDARGWTVSVCKGAGEAITFLESLGYGKKGA